MNHGELRQIITDFSVTMGELQKKFEAVKKELDTDREQEIKALIKKVIDKEGNRLILNKYDVSKKVVARMLKGIKKQVDKMELDSMGQILGRIRKMSDYEKFVVAEYILNEAQVKSLKKQNKSRIFTGELD